MVKFQNIQDYKVDNLEVVEFKYEKYKFKIKFNNYINNTHVMFSNQIQNIQILTTKTKNKSQVKYR